LTAQQIPVPPGFIIRAEAYSRMLRESQIEARLRQVQASADDDAQSAASAASSLILDAKMPSDIETAIRAAYAKLGGGLVAVRSSATAEDLAEASFAGQQSTYLNVSGEDGVVRAVQDCWASLFEERAVVYRRQVGFDDASVRIAVVVQSMVQSERSGIMFTVNPVTGDADGMVIEAIMGLGEAAVSGMVTPDMYILDKGTLEMQQCEVSHQEQQFIRADTPTADGELNEWVPLPPQDGRAQKLSDEQIRELAELGVRIENHYGRPQDIEWAWADGQFFILQARPVTAAGL
jgi:pyruvate,water dikinase